MSLPKDASKARQYMKDFTHLSIANQPADIYTKVTVLVRATSQFGD